MTTILLNTSSLYLIFGFVPEKFGLLFFGVILIILASVLRRIFNKKNEHKDENELSR